VSWLRRRNSKTPPSSPLVSRPNAGSFMGARRSSGRPVVHSGTRRTDVWLRPHRGMRRLWVRLLR
jgi:hypothetical protein